MQLKERSTVVPIPRYVHQAKYDFKELAETHKVYEQEVLTHKLWPKANYDAQRQIRISNPDNYSKIAGWSVEKELESLILAYKQVEILEMRLSSRMKIMFEYLYGDFNDMYNDLTNNFISHETYKSYLPLYKEAIDTNKRLQLNHWNKQPTFDKIEKQIAETLK